MGVARATGSAPCRCADQPPSNRRPSAVTGRVIRRMGTARLRWRRATARWRVLPDFVVVGAQKAGTTSLYAYLTDHPQVLPASSKELHFFDTCAWDAGPTAYRAHFPLKAHMRLAAWLRRARVITGEATPYYLYHPLAAERLHATAPGTKVIILLRDPVERALSHYWHEVRGGRESLPLEEALRAEPGRLRGRERALVAGEPPCRHREHRNFSYQDRGRYARQIAAYLALFGPDQVLVLKSEELFGDDEGPKARLAAFLGLPELTRPFVAENVGGRSRNDAADDPVRRMLAANLGDDLPRLRTLVGDRFEWRSPERAEAS